MSSPCEPRLAHRCMALLLYHGSAVSVHMLAACLLWRQTAAYRHERIKCLTLVIAFVIMMVRRLGFVAV